MGRAETGGQSLAPMDGAGRDGIVSEKKSLRAAEQDTPANQLRRSIWRQETSQIDPSKLVFLHESGGTTEMTRRYGRAGRGERVGEGTPLRPLANLDGAGSDPRFRMGGDDD